MYVDTREPPKIFNLMEKFDVQFEKKALEVGDFVKGDVCIERKTIEDFVQSIKSGHLQKQLLKMEEKFARPYLIISGTYKSLFANPYFKYWTTNNHMGALAHLSRYPKLKVFQVPNDTQLINLVTRIMRKSFDGRTVTVADTEVFRKSMDSEDIKMCLLCAIPGIGYEKAKKLRNNVDFLILNKDGDICKTKDLMQIDGFGKSMATRVLKSHLFLNHKKQDIRKKIAEGIFYEKPPSKCGTCDGNLSSSKKELVFCSQECFEEKFYLEFDSRMKREMEKLKKEQVEKISKSEEEIDVESIKEKSFDEGFYSGLIEAIKQEKVCPHCREHEIESVHHIMPRKHGGKLIPENIIFLCFKCHNKVEILTDEVFKKNGKTSMNELREMIKNDSFPTPKGNPEQKPFPW